VPHRRKLAAATRWGRFFKLAGYTAGKPLIDREGVNFVPLGLLGQAGITWAVQPNDAQGNPVVTQNGTPEAYGFTAELGSKITDWAGVFAEYGVSNTFPGWKAATGPIDIRATHFFSVGNHELLVGIDSNNDPSVQDVWNTVPVGGYPFYGSPEAPGAPGGPMISSLGQETGSIGMYALFDRQFYVELSEYSVGKGFYSFMNGGISYATGAQYLKGFNPTGGLIGRKIMGPTFLWWARSGCTPKSIRTAGLAAVRRIRLPTRHSTHSINI
jgi:hypothetical protein